MEIRKQTSRETLQTCNRSKIRQNRPPRYRRDNILGKRENVENNRRSCVLKFGEIIAFVGKSIAPFVEYSFVEDFRNCVSSRQNFIDTFLFVVTV